MIARKLALGIGILCGGCARVDRTPGDTIVVVTGANPGSLDPRFAADSLGSKIGELVCPGLTARAAADGALVPELAASWRWESPTRLAFHLRDGVLFSDGSPVTSHDVASTYSSIRDPAVASVYAEAFSEVASIETPTDRDVVFVLRRPSAPLLQNLVSPGVLKEGTPSAPGGFPVCAGPYVVTSFVRDEEVRLTASAHAWRGAPATPNVVFRIVPDVTIRVLELMHGSADLLQNDVAPHFLPVLRKQPHLRIESRPGRILRYLVFNLRAKPLGDVRVRRAIAMAIDRDALIAWKAGGMARPADTILPPEDPSFSPVAAIPHDPAAARALRDAAGLSPDANGVRLALEYKTSEDETGIAIAKVIKSELAQVGIALTIRPAEFGIFFHDVQTGNFSLYSLTSAAIVDGDFDRWMLASDNVPPRGQSSNRAGFVDAEVDALLEQGAAETDAGARRATYAKIAAIAARDLPVVPLWDEDVVAVESDRLQGYAISPFASYVGLAAARKEATP